MTARSAFDASVAVAWAIYGLLIFTGWAIWHKRATMLLVFALGAAAALALSGCSAGKIVFDAAHDGVIR